MKKIILFAIAIISIISLMSSCVSLEIEEPEIIPADELTVYGKCKPIQDTLYVYPMTYTDIMNMNN